LIPIALGTPAFRQEKMKTPVPSTVGGALLVLFGTAQAAASPTPYRASRLPDGQIDMQGIWKNSNLTPLERPQAFTQLTITAADAARLKAEYSVAMANIPDDPGRDLDRSFEPIRGELRSSLIIDPDDGKIPWNDLYKDKPEALRRAVLSAFDNPEQRPALERCLGSTAAPPMQPAADNNVYQIVQTPGTTAIVSEFIHDVRLIRMNSTHSPAVITSWLGDSVGWWEHDTLVVETKNFSLSSAVRLGSRYLFLVSPQTNVVERFTLVSDNELNYVFTVTDPTYYTRSWTAETHLLRSNVKLYEIACHEGNYSMRGILETERLRDAKESTDVASTSAK
jgi:hypothetical protein